MERIHRGPRLCLIFHNKFIFYGEELLAPSPTSELEDDPLSFVRCCLLNIFAATPITIIRIIKSRRMRWAGHVAQIGEKRNAYRLLVGYPDGKRPLGRPRRRWVDNIRMDLGKVGWDDVDWIGLAQDWNRWRSLVNSVLNLRVR
jgi:hypothetical protein